MRLKICRIREPSEVETIAAFPQEQRADDLGFQYWSRLQHGGGPVALKNIKIMAGIAIEGGINPVLVTYGTSAQKIANYAHAMLDDHEINFDRPVTPQIQLVNDVSTTQLELLREHLTAELPHVQIIKSFGARNFSASRLVDGGKAWQFNDMDLVDGYVFDSHAGDQRGGTGEAHNWGWAYMAFFAIRMMSPSLSIQLAGGINLSNIDRAGQLGADGLDVETGSRFPDDTLNLGTIKIMAEKVHGCEDPVIMPPPTDMEAYKIKFGPHGSIEYRRVGDV